MTDKHREAIDLLEDLPGQARQALLARDKRVTLEAGEALFEAGGPAEALYIVNKGTLGIYVNRPGTGRHLLALVRHGEVVGEMAVISGRPRSASAIAIRDCELVKLSAAEFRALEKRYPQLSIALNRLLVRRLRETSQGGAPERRPRTNAFIAATPAVDPLAVAGRLKRELERMGRSVHLATPKGHGETWPDLARIEADFDHVFLCGDRGNGSWTQMCARQADRIIALGRMPGCADRSFPREVLVRRAGHQLADLLLLHPSGTSRPEGTAEWLEASGASRHFHLREDKDSDWRRMARVFDGVSVGLVLSGGGARAYAHIGVLKALKEARIPIDFIGGASMGAIIAACGAMGWPLEEAIPRIKRAFVEHNPLSDYSLPIIGLVRGGRVERLLEENFGNTRIPDLWRPFFCVSTNLTTGEVMTHRRDRVRDALRASVALPGILPPVSTPEGVLADGGVMNNLPVDVMASMNNGPIIAVDVARDLAVTPAWLEKVQKTPLIWRMLRPPIISILMRAGTVTNEDQNRANAEAADLVMSPPLGDIDIRDWKAFDKAVDIGYRYAQGVLEREAERLLRPRPPQ